MIRQRLDRRGWLRSAAGLTAAVASAQPPRETAGSIAGVGGIRVGHFTDTRRPTGCTVILFDHGAVTGADVRGSAPGTRETELLHPINTVERVNALVLAGGSAFGLDAANGVMRYLEENHQGFRVGPIVVPIVPAAILFDLNIGDARIRPNAESGYLACRAAVAEGIREGNVGAGAGATVGKFFGLRSAMKSGLGMAGMRIGSSEIVVGAIVAVNAAGDVIGPHGKILAGALTPDQMAFRDTVAQIAAGALLDHAHTRSGANTTIGVIATNAAFTKTEMTKIAQMTHDGLARSISPVHTAADGDTIFAASVGNIKAKADVTTIGVVAAEVMARAVRRAVLQAESIPGYPAYRDLPIRMRTDR